MCDFRIVPVMTPEAILESLKRYRVPHDRIASAIGRDRTAATKMLGGTRSIKTSEIPALLALLREYGAEDIVNTPDLPGADAMLAYVPVEVLPTYAGLGGGGTGDGERATALVSRALVTHELRARPEDLLMIELRGDSMIDPKTGRGFMHGDQVLIDKRDTNPRQPGAFALWFDDGYVVKNVEIIRSTGRLRIFSNNPAYSDDEADPADVQIMGRPVWYGRRVQS